MRVCVTNRPEPECRRAACFVDKSMTIWCTRRLQSEVTRLELNNKEESMTAQRLAMDNEQLWYKLQSLQRRPSPTHSHNGKILFYQVASLKVFLL